MYHLGVHRISKQEIWELAPMLAISPTAEAWCWLSPHCLWEPCCREEEVGASRQKAQDYWHGTGTHPLKMAEGLASVAGAVSHPDLSLEQRTVSFKGRSRAGEAEGPYSLNQNPDSEVRVRLFPQNS